MIEEQAIVVDIHDDNASLEIVRRSACTLCGQTRGCGVSMLGRLFGHNRNIFRAKNHINAKAGDTVIVGIEDQALLMSSVIVYGVPLAGLIAGAVLASVIGADTPALADRNAALSAIAGLSLGLLWVKLYAAGKSVSRRFQPVILRAADISSINFKCE